jgi:hypothetical protein
MARAVGPNARLGLSIAVGVLRSMILSLEMCDGKARGTISCSIVGYSSERRGYVEWETTNHVRWQVAKTSIGNCERSHAYGC